jgi:hypothetical protein
MRMLSWPAAFALLALPVWAADPGKSSVKTGTTPVPKELAASIRPLLGDQTIQLLDEKGKAVAEFWFRKEVPVKAKADEVKKGLKYRQVEQSTIMGAVRFDQEWTDFRKQKVKPGVYTLRLAFQPQDGNHQGSAPFNEFCLLVPAAEDKKPDLVDFKILNEMSSKATAEGTHAAVVLLFPNDKPPEKPSLVSKPDGIWVLHWKEEVAGSGQKGTLGLGVVVFGATTAE